MTVSHGGAEAIASRLLPCLTAREKEPRMPTYYVEDYDGDRSADAVEPITLSPVVEAKVVTPEAEKPAAKKTSRAKTKG